MPIIIENTGGNLEGKCSYRLRINGEVIATFDHNRPDGLAQCLKEARKAVQAVDAKNEGERLRKIRQKTWLSMREAGRLVDVSVGYICDMEKGRKPLANVGRKLMSMLKKKAAAV